MVGYQDLIAKFKQAFDEHWGYIWGAAGRVWTAAAQQAATREMTVRYGAQWIGSKVADCSGLFAWAMKELGGYLPHGSNSIWKGYCVSKGKLVTGLSIRPGTAVFLTNGEDRHHIGLYIGDGNVIEARGTKTGVIMSELNHWDEWGELKGVDYGDAAVDNVEKIPPTVRKGDSGETVRTLQKALNEKGFKLEEDGIFGTMTYGAVLTFQTRNDLNMDGIVGPKTWRALLAVDSPDLEASPENEDGDLTFEEKIDILWNWYIENKGVE